MQQRIFDLFKTLATMPDDERQKILSEVKGGLQPQPSSLADQLMQLPPEERASVVALAQQKRQERSSEGIPTAPQKPAEATLGAVIGQSTPEPPSGTYGTLAGPRAEHKVRSMGGKMGSTLADVLGRNF